MTNISMKIYPLHKIVLSFRQNPEPFLNGLTSNSMDKPQNAFVSIHGKIIATFDQVKISDEEIWILVEPDFVQAVLDTSLLTPYSSGLGSDNNDAAAVHSVGFD